MRFKYLERFHKTLAFRLTFWYSAIFILGFLFLSVISYLFVFASIRDNRPAIRAALSQYVALAEQGGVQAIESAVRDQAHPSRRTSFFVRVVDADDKTIFLSNPRLWAHFNLTRPQDQLVEGQWHYYTSTRDGDLLEVASARLPEGALLQVGKSIQDRNDVLEHFRDALLATTIPMVLIGFSGGAFLAFRALRPIRDLSAAARSIVDTARFDTRVPGTRGGAELNDLVRLFNQMLAKIETLIRGMTESLDNVAHDLRTPVTRLRGMAEQALRTGGSREACLEALADCLEESERVMSMLNTLMDVSEAETGTMRLAREDIDLSTLVGEVAELYHDVAEEKGIQISTHTGQSLYLRADRSRLRQVLGNLVDNAVKYTAQGGRIDIEVCQEKESAVLLVKDNGSGIPADELPRIWDRLYRGDKSRSQRGLGLGLSLVKAVVQAHGGEVKVSPNPGGGSVFAVFLPLTRAV
jgi:signal transduction histidine kinase